MVGGGHINQYTWALFVNTRIDWNSWIILVDSEFKPLTQQFGT